MKEIKTLIFDIETAKEISGNFGRYNINVPETSVLQESYMICAAWKWLDKKRIYTSKTYTTDDKEVITDLAAAIEEADEVVGHNIAGFDLPYLEARLYHHSLPPLVLGRVVDTLKAAKKLRLPSRRLDSLCKRKGHIGKQGNDPRLWDMIAAKQFAGMSPKKEVDAMTKYCSYDIEASEFIYNDLKGRLAGQGVNRDLKGNGVCPECGSPNVHKRGLRRTRTAEYQRYTCHACAASFRGPDKLNTKTKVNR